MSDPTTAFVSVCTLIQQRTPQHMLGRVVVFWMFASTGVMPLAQFMGGVIANAVSPQRLFMLAGNIVLLGDVLGGSVRRFADSIDGKKK